MRITIFAVLLMSLSRDAQLGAQYVGVRATDGNAAASGAGVHRPPQFEHRLVVLKLSAPLVAPLCPALVALALVALRGAVLALANLQLPAPVAPVADAVGASPAPPARVMVVVIDGLRADVAAELPFVRELGERGARAELTSEVPVFSSAQYVSMLTGVPPRDSGVRTNVGLQRTPLDNVARRLRAAGRRGVEIGDQVDWWRTLFGDDIATTRVTAPDALPVEAIALMPGADLLLVHLCDVDRAGHDAGAASAAYQAAARTADDKTRRLAAAWGWPAANVVVLADHGHTWRGGHGGDEADVRQSFFVAGGPAIAAGARGASMRMIDVAPTLAAMLGVTAPATAQGHAWLDALALPAPVRAALAGADDARIGGATAAATAARAPLSNAEQRARLLRLAGLCRGAGGDRARRPARAAGRGPRPRVRCGGGGADRGGVRVALRRAVVQRRSHQRAPRLRDGLIAAVACAVGFAPAFVAVVRRRLTAAHAAAAALGAAVGAAPAAMVAFVAAGAFGPRLACEPGWFAALPLVAYVAFVPRAADGGAARRAYGGNRNRPKPSTSVASGRGPGR